ncbi:hypothetical protein FPRO04_08099 [Fusarium proliferatum]|nr:hypothetical protein FPRO04_08099 [Fusarium proliferatum]
MAASSVLPVQKTASNVIAHINNKSRPHASFISLLFISRSQRDSTQDRCGSSSRLRQVGASRWKSIMSTTIITIITTTITPTLSRLVYLQMRRKTMSLILNLDALSPEAQARFTTIQSDKDDHQDGPPRKKARASGCPARPKSQGESQHHSAVAQQSDNMTVIDQARIIYVDGNFRVVNCDPAGPQVNIRWRVPGQRNVWLLRIPLSSMERSFGRILGLLRPEAPGDMPVFHTYAATPDDETVSMIISSSGKHTHNRFERGGGIAVPNGPGFVSTLGRLMGFEVLGG